MNTPTLNHVFLILNPVAGTGDPDTTRETIEQHFSAANIRTEVYETTGDADESVAAIARDAAQRGFDLIVAVGGDGTVSDVAAGLRDTDTPIGIVPTGTANALAHSLTIPIGNLDDACHLLVQSPAIASIDAMQIGDTFAVLHVGIGVGSLAIRDTRRDAKRRFGRLAYAWSTAKRLFGLQPRRYTITVDGTTQRYHAAQVQIASAGAMGVPVFRWSPDIRPDDGAVDVCVINARTIPDYAGVAWNMLTRQHRRDRRLRFVRAHRHISIQADKPMPVQADGEIVGETPIEIQVLPGVVRVVVPSDNVSEPEQEPETAPVKDALQHALSQIRTPEDAHRVVDELLAQAGWTTEPEVHQRERTTGHPARKVVQTTTRTPPEDEPGAALVESAKGVAGSSGETREALEQALLQATNPEQQSTEQTADREMRGKLGLLRRALVRRMSPLQGVDATLFLAINHLPHTPLTNRVMTTITNVMNGGLGWVIGLSIAAVVDKKRGVQALHQVAPPLWFAAMTVEYPIKAYFRRRRPFIDVVQAIAVGRKPGTYSFPSAHSAAAFAGAWLISHHYPERAALWYAIAGTVAFSRVYLGVHYPGDVASGAVTGLALAEALRWVIAQGERPRRQHPLFRQSRRWF